MTLGEEVAAKIQEFQDHGLRAKQEAVTVAVLADHELRQSEDRDWWLICARKAIDNEFRGVAKRYELKPEVTADKQLVLAGFERLQHAYSVRRDGEQELVPIYAMTDAEWEQKEEELAAMGRGCFQHLDEIRRFRRARRVVAKPTAADVQRITEAH